MENMASDSRSTLGDRLKSLWNTYGLEVLKFGTVGGAAFLVNAAVVWALMLGPFENAHTKAKVIASVVATIFAWTGALRKRGELDGLSDLVAFADKLEKAVIDTVESGIMTKDLAEITTLKEVKTAGTEDFIKAVRERLEKSL